MAEVKTKEEKEEKTREAGHDLDSAHHERELSRLKNNPLKSFLEVIVISHVTQSN